MTEAIEIALGFIESESVREHMRGYLSQEKFSVSYYLCDIICHARASLEDKAAALEKIAKLLPLDEEEYYQPQGLADAARWALNETNYIPPGSVFLLRRFNRSKVYDDYGDGKDDYWMCEFDYESIGEYSDIYVTFEQAVKAIREEYFGEEDGKEYPADDYHQFWNEIARYDLNAHGELHEAISWVVGESGVIWSFDVYEIRNTFTMRKRAHDCDEEFSLFDDFHVPTPFVPGDIVTADPRPFYPVFHAVVLENDNPRDCCSVQVVFVNSKRRISNGSLCHWKCHIPNAHGTWPRFSPYYRLEKYDGELSEGEAILRRLSEAIKSHPEWNEVPGRSYIGDCLHSAEDNREKSWYGVEQACLKALLDDADSGSE